MGSRALRADLRTLVAQLITDGTHPNQVLFSKFFKTCSVMASMAPCDTLDMRKLTRQMGIRMFTDQLDDLERIRSIKYRDRCPTSYLIRLAVDRFIQEEDKRIAKAQQMAAR